MQFAEEHSYDWASALWWDCMDEYFTMNSVTVWQFICSTKYLSLLLSNKNPVAASLLQHFNPSVLAISEKPSKSGFIMNSVTFLWLLADSPLFRGFIF